MITREQKLVDVNHHGIDITIGIRLTPLTHAEAWEPCGDGAWIYCKDRKSLERVSIGSHSDIDYHSHEFKPQHEYHKVISSSHPLWVWWGHGCKELKWGNPGIALPQLK